MDPWTSWILYQKDSSYKCQIFTKVCKCISKAGPASLKYVPVEYKDQVLDVSDSHRNIGISCNFKVSSPKFKDMWIKSVDSWEYSLGVSYNVNDAKVLKNLSYHCRLLIGSAIVHTC